MKRGPVARRPSATYWDLAIALVFILAVLVVVALIGAGIDFVMGGRGEIRGFAILLPATFAIVWFWRLYFPRTKVTTPQSDTAVENRSTAGEPPPVAIFRWTAWWSTGTMAPLLLVNLAMLAGLGLSSAFHAVTLVVPLAASLIAGGIWFIPSLWCELRSGDGALRVDERSVTFETQQGRRLMPWEDIARVGLRTTRVVRQHHLFLVPRDPSATFLRMAEQSPRLGGRYRALAMRGADALATSLDGYIEPATVVQAALRARLTYQGIPVIDIH